MKEFERKLQQADIVASRAGVLTYVNLNLGQKVAEGGVLARIADLNSYKILGIISDAYAEQRRGGMPVLISQKRQFADRRTGQYTPCRFQQCGQFR
ncbi:MAG: HlyD family secretion protein [Lewinellaceae bacterium]|nr:HlyD family secretion protein [Lewinellaceae bacterium]